ncbi:uncharacterized protein EAE97_001182 [Botrytis byssoidea]|uniref:Uncharacterized protein n=1 Tax=Botrytis byssoidea TaxID=139641 RepID=A0A9P5M3Q2_9HELO|nr:uncharacterized protein EAE97_001182 [Botrytis byssoidea]KAF7953783.1 hypothetical protein EAE97_001182 [Botrytis byssoidea]
MSTTFAPTSASALETPVIVIDTCLVSADFAHFSSSPFTPSLSALSPSSSHSPPVSTFLNIPRFFMTPSPSTRYLRVHQGRPMRISSVTPLTPVNSPASPVVRDVFLGVPELAVGSPSLRWRGWGLESFSGVYEGGCECNGERLGAGAGIERGEVLMSPVVPPNTPCSPLVLGRLERGGKNEGDEKAEGEECGVLILSQSQSENEESIDTFQNTSEYSTSERVFENIPQIVVGFEEEGWGYLDVQAEAESEAEARINERCIGGKVGDEDSVVELIGWV